MQEARWDQVHDQRLPLLQPGSDQQRGGCRGYREGVREGLKDGLDAIEPQLGPELAVQRGFGGPGPVLSGHGQ